MSPREKGRYLRERGWRSTSYAGKLGWSDPRHPSKGSVSTSEAFAKEKSREKDGT